MRVYMTGPKQHRGSKPAREIFLTSSSLSFSSLSSSCSSSSNDGIEIHMKASPTSCEDQKGKHVKDSSRGSEMSCVTHVTMQPAPSPPSRLRPVGLGSPYDPERIPASVFGKAKDLNWSDESLFSLRMSNYDAFCIPEDLLMPGEFLAYSPSLKIKSEDAKEEIIQTMEKKETSVETNIKSSSPTPPSYSYPSSFAQLYQAPPPSTKVQPFCLPTDEEEEKKTRKSKKKEKKKNKKKNKCCCIWSWLFSKCKCYVSCCYKGRKCGSGCCCCK